MKIRKDNPRTETEKKQDEALLKVIVEEGFLKPLTDGEIAAAREYKKKKLKERVNCKETISIHHWIELVGNFCWYESEPGGPLWGIKLEVCVDCGTVRIPIERWTSKTEDRLLLGYRGDDD